MFKRTIIFLSGFMVPKWLSKSDLVWSHSRWPNYRKIYISSKIPTTDSMVEGELRRLAYFTRLFPNVVVAGQSLGGWWAANLACEPTAQMKKVIFWTPLVDANSYPIFPVSRKHHPLNKLPNSKFVGPHKSLVLYGNKDKIVPHQDHSNKLISHFDSVSYKLEGGHYLQSNHYEAISYMRDWIEID